jgi:tricorn protease
MPAASHYPEARSHDRDRYAPIRSDSRPCYPFRTGIPVAPLSVICNERTASDGEAFAEGFKRLDLGQVIGTRTWGGEIWLSARRWLVDRGMATAAEVGVYGPEGEWLIEGHGVDPDSVVDNLPHATFNGRDAQLDAAIDHLLELIAKEPNPVPPPPPYPDKSLAP